MSRLAKFCGSYLAIVGKFYAIMEKLVAFIKRNYFVGREWNLMSKF